MKRYINFAASLLLIGALTTEAQSQKALRIPLTGDSDKNTLVVRINNGPVKVIGTDRQDVLITYSALYNSQPRAEAVEGEMRRITGGMPEIEISESNRVVNVDSRDWNIGLRLEIEVPKTTDVDLHSHNNGDLEISSVDGEHVMETHNGQIIARNVQGSLSANTFNGKIDCQIISLHHDVPMTFSNFTGGINVRLPESAKLNLKLKSRRGEVFTDFYVDFGPIVFDEKTNTSDGTRYTQNNWIGGKINGGGALLTLENHHGDIHIRK